MKSIKTTDKDLELFKSEVLRLVDLFHIDTWDIYIELKKMVGCQACCTTNITGRSATFSLNTEIYLYTDEKIKETALHEVCHLLLADVVDIGQHRYVTEDEAIKASETVACKLQSIFKELGVLKGMD